MDKYTVDLDKVLNDFEYSELTDQYNVDTSASHFQSVNSSLQRLKNNTPIKHTINNVFQSLNEYLNSDISGSNSNKSSIKKQLSLDVNDDQSTCVNDSNNELQSFNNNQEVIVSTVADSDDLGSNIAVTVESSQSITEISIFEGCHAEENQNLLVPVDESLPNDNSNQDLSESCKVQDENNTIIDFINEENVESLKNSISDVEDDVIHCSSSLEIKQEVFDESEPKPLLQETISINLETKPEISDNNLKPVLNQSVIHLETNEIPEGNETPETDVNQQSLPTSESPLKLESSNVEFSEVLLEQVPKAIGFDDTIGIDDEELHLYLDALESELEIDTNLKKVEKESVRPNTLPVSPPQIDLVGEPGSTPYNNMYTASVEKPPTTDSETSPSASPTFSDASSGSNISTATTDSVTDSVVETTSEVVPPLASVVDEGERETTQLGGLEETPQSSTDYSWLGKQAPLWIPDSEALNCLHCDNKFTVIKRRHHCRACGLVLCSKCCNMKFKLEYLDAEARVCLKCLDKLIVSTTPTASLTNQPNPNNPMEYCSVVPPLQQINSDNQNPPTVLVPVGVLKRTGSAKSRTNKSVMFCDGIRPGSELTNLDSDFNYNQPKKKGPSPPPIIKPHRNTPTLDDITKSFIPNEESFLPPTVTIFKSDITYTECANAEATVESLKNETLMFALQNNLFVNVRIINMDCCINKWAWCFSTQGMITVGQDEIVLLLELSDDDKVVPKDVFFHLNDIYIEAKKGSGISENGISLHSTPNFLSSKNHMGFLYIRQTFQCLQNVIIPKEPYLIGILIHRWEMPWAKIFPLRLILRLGAAYRYYPSPIISVRNRESVYVEVGHTIINLLADFRNYSYMLPSIRGLTIHMEGKSTTVTIPRNRYDQVMKSLNTSSDQTLAFGGNFSMKADSHLVCVQDVDGNNENAYSTHSISIQNRPRIVTGVNFIVFNGSLKLSSGLTAKSSLVEDGLMIQIRPEQMKQIHESLRNMKNYTINCGCVNATSDESVTIVWGENDTNFNQGVVSAVDNQSLSGVPSIRVHNGKDYVSSSGNRMIRWTEVFIMENGDAEARGQDVNFSKLSENIAEATCQALTKYLDLLSSNNFCKIGIRPVLHAENVSYSAGSNGTKLPPIYMKSLDNELIQVLHRITSNNDLGGKPVVLELIFHILNA